MYKVIIDIRRNILTILFSMPVLWPSHIGFVKAQWQHCDKTIPISSLYRSQLQQMIIKSQCVVTPETCRSVVAVYLQCNSRDGTTKALQMYSDSNAAITRQTTRFANRVVCRVIAALESHIHKPQVNARQNAQHSYCEHTVTAMWMSPITCWTIKKDGSFCGYDWIFFDPLGFYPFLLRLVIDISYCMNKCSALVFHETAIHATTWGFSNSLRYFMCDRCLVFGNNIILF